jgi:DNA-binding winged helix-turn-helix (wHTH) protein/predicted ATPase
MPDTKEITFGQFRLDLTNECLWQGSRAIALRPKAFAVLKLLVEHPGQLVNKQQVLDSVWPGTFVGDAVLKDSIRQLREALSDDAAFPTYIETAHRRGYRFIAKLSLPVLEKRQTAFVPGSQLAFAPSAEILGRQSEMIKMRGWLGRALAGERQTVFVTGEPGIGKTTIVQALLREASQMPGLRIISGQCLEHYGVCEPYLPILEGFSRLCRLANETGALEVLRQQAPAWLIQMPSLTTPMEREALQASGIGATRERMLREMAETIETLASASPLLLVLEDLHWSDYSTLDLLSYLARRRDSAHLMVIATYRPVDIVVSNHPLKDVKRELHAHGMCHDLPLEYLSEMVIEEYMRVRFPENRFPARLGRTIHQRTEGNPLFMVDLVEYLTDQKLIVEEQGTWKLLADLTEVEQGVPLSLRQLIERRIERLSPDERAVLEGASVVGMECSSVAIAAGLDKPLEWVERHCEELARRHQFLSPAWLIELPDQTVTPCHRFVHTLFRDVPYRLIAPMRRSQIHLRIAEGGVTIYGDRASEIAAELAMHFEEARNWPRALEYLLHAAENATARSAHREATDLARRGLEVLKYLPDTPRRRKQEIRLRMLLGVSLMAIKGFAAPELEEVYATAKNLYLLNEPSPQLFNMLYLLGLFYITGGRIGSALEIAVQLLELGEELKDPILVMEAHRAMGSTLIELGRGTEAVDHFERALRLYADNQSHPYTLTIGHDCKVLTECSVARALWALGFPDKALQRMDAGLAFAREISHPQSLVAAAHLSAQLHQLRGEPMLAHQRATEVIKLAEEHGLELWVALGNIDLGWANAGLGRAEHGIEEMRQGFADYEATGGKLWSPYFLGLMAETLGKVGRIDEGLAANSKGIELAEKTGERFSLAELYRIRGELLAKAEKPREEAATFLMKSLNIAIDQQAKSWELRTLISIRRYETGAVHDDNLLKCLNSFTEGFETEDLREAVASLTENLRSYVAPKLRDTFR